ncbi:F-box protein family-like [Zostera marina]|uniref:F-box protein family-like n=1 Tax=Zostera marina TaxID=29655 RepID=A0A0K9PRZ8_ZOSMR|nr:F-box protein family-like [Zostera marina]
MQSKSRIHADEEEFKDQFNRIPDSLVLLILNRLADVRDLCRCASVSKRFNLLVPLVDDVFVRIDQIVAADGDSSDESSNYSSTKCRNIFSQFFKLVLFNVLKPFNHLRSGNRANNSLRGNTGGGGGNRSLLLFPQLGHHSPAHVLRNFTHIRNLQIELPSGDVGTEEGVLLKWRAEFGSTLQNCVILGGTQIEKKLPNPESPAPTGTSTEAEDSSSIPESFYTNGGLKLRVVWTISSLIAASTRHYLLRPIIKDHPTLCSLVLTDADDQGTLTMGKEQLREFREKPLKASASSSRTQVPASNMKLRYAPQLELPNGVAMQGATMVAIRPSFSGEVDSDSSGNSGGKEEADAFISTSFNNSPFEYAINTLVKQRTYLLEMNGF